MGGGWGERGAIVCTATLALGSRQFSENRAILTQLAAIENTASSGWAGGWMMGWVDDGVSVRQSCAPPHSLALRCRQLPRHGAIFTAIEAQPYHFRHLHPNPYNNVTSEAEVGEAADALLCGGIPVAEGLICRL